jgi:hypothetical protein
MKMASYLRNLFLCFGKSFCLRLSSIYAFLADLVLFLIFIISYLLFQNVLHSKMLILQATGASTESIKSNMVAALTPFLASAKGFIFAVSFGFLLMIVIGLIAYTISRGIIWHFLLDRKISLRYFSRFALLNLLWFFVLLCLITIFGLLLKNSALIIILFILIPFYLLFTTYLHILWDEKKAWNTIKLAVKTGFKHLKYHIVPAILALIVLVILTIILIGFQMFLSGAFDTIMALILILYLVWLRNYIYHVYLSISKRKH